MDRHARHAHNRELIYPVAAEAVTSCNAGWDDEDMPWPSRRWQRPPARYHRRGHTGHTGQTKVPDRQSPHRTLANYSGRTRSIEQPIASVIAKTVASVGFARPSSSSRRCSGVIPAKEAKRSCV